MVQCEDQIQSLNSEVQWSSAKVQLLNLMIQYHPQD